MHFVQIWKRGPHCLDEINDRPPLDMFWQFFFLIIRMLLNVFPKYLVNYQGAEFRLPCLL